MPKYPANRVLNLCFFLNLFTVKIHLLQVKSVCWFCTWNQTEWLNHNIFFPFYMSLIQRLLPWLTVCLCYLVTPRWHNYSSLVWTSFVWLLPKYTANHTMMAVLFGDIVLGLNWCSLCRHQLEFDLSQLLLCSINVL